ncbi:MAG: ribonuclease H-like domain-containing protein [Proteobacteria bacterium]|nr:ribonuclease H-like domain-containing protein [Pseudomonadota bacterium]
MSGLKDRLRRQIGDPRSKTPDPEPEAAPSEMLQRLRRLHRPSRPRPREEAPKERPYLVKPFRRTDVNRPVVEPPRIERTEVSRAGTACLHGVHRWPAEHLHGSIAIGDVLRVDGPAAVLLSGDADLADFDPTEALFFDLETTGLLGGSGNLAFLSGALEVHADGAATLHQFMLRDPTEEAAALTLFVELMERKRFLVSFNGKSFDRNVMADRFTMNRMDPDPILAMPHLDLLHPSRRLFAKALGGSSLSVLEEKRLGVHRHESEVRGAEVPERWFEFLRTGREQLLAPVLDHNAIDLVSLLTLAAHLVACVNAPGAKLPEPRALVAAARLLIERGEAERGEEVLRLLVRDNAADPVAYGAHGVLAEHLRRVGRHDEAVVLWRRMMRAAGAADLDPWVSAAIALEWRLGLPAEALELIEDLLDRLTATRFVPELPELHRRRDRLKRRVGGARRGDPAPSPRPGTAGCDVRARTAGIGG